MKPIAGTIEMNKGRLPPSAPPTKHAADEEAGAAGRVLAGVGGASVGARAGGGAAARVEARRRRVGKKK